MGLEAVALGITQITAVVAMGVFLWQVFSRRFDAVDAKFDKLDAKVGDLAKDHQSLARELSEFRGEMRGRLDALHPVE
ncbi:MAG: hypothetical protein OXG44_13365 [Gammaproteobacteria bacterium]|nr:hypothetical protein [Gammaproteobacteria bacterium]